MPGHPTAPVVPPHPLLGPFSAPVCLTPLQPHKCSASPWTTITRASSSPRWLLWDREQSLPASSYHRLAPELTWKLITRSHRDPLSSPIN